jgi:Protein of unknown function (DUF550)
MSPKMAKSGAETHSELVREALVSESAYFKEKMAAAYTERNRLVAFLASVFPSVVHTPETGPDMPPSALHTVYVQTPAGQMSWHFMERDAHLFAHLPRAKDGGALWDGHTTEEKHRRLARLPRMKCFDGWDLIVHLGRQRLFSLEAYGPGLRTQGMCAHIRKELEEVAANPTDLREWVDVILLAFDGALRTGSGPWDIASAIEWKLKVNQGREWPDWRTVPEGQAIEHVRGGRGSTRAQAGIERLRQVGFKVDDGSAHADALSAAEIDLLHRLCTAHVKLGAGTNAELFARITRLLHLSLLERNTLYPTFVSTSKAGREQLQALGWRI